MADARVVVETAAREPIRARTRVRVAALHFALGRNVAAVARSAAITLYNKWVNVVAGVLYRNQKEERQE